MVFDLKDDGKWPFGFQPHPNLKIYLTVNTAFKRYQWIEKNVNLEDTITKFQDVYIHPDQLKDITKVTGVPAGTYGVLQRAKLNDSFVALKSGHPHMKVNSVLHFLLPYLFKRKLYCN